MKKALLLIAALLGSTGAISAFADTVPNDGKTYDAVDGFTCTSLWMYDADQSAEIWNRYVPHSDGMSRSATIDAKRGKIYVSSYKDYTSSSSVKGYIYVYDLLTGEQTETVPLIATSYGNLFSAQICVDDYGNVLIGSSQVGGSNLVVQLVNMETGVCTATNLPMSADGTGARTDYFDVKGDFTGVNDGCVIAAVPSAKAPSSAVVGDTICCIYRWSKEIGATTWDLGFNDGENVSVKVKDTYPESALTYDGTDSSNGWDTSAILKILTDGDDEYYIVDGHATAPAVYDMEGNLIPSFKDAASLVPAYDTNGVCEFKIGGTQFIAYSEDQYTGKSPVAVCALPDGDIDFSAMTKYWQLPNGGIDNAGSNGGARIHPIVAATVSDSNGKQGAILFDYECEVCMGVYIIAEEDFDITTVEFEEDADAPAVTSEEASDINADYVTLSGQIDAGTETIAEQGFEYWVSAGSTQSTSADLDGSDVSTEVDDLTAATDYYFRAYATTANGPIYYSSILAFTTADIIAPTVTTGDSDDITTSSASVAGSVEAGNEKIKAYGFKYGTTNDVDSADGDVEAEAGEDGSLTAELSGLNSNTEYYFWAYVTTGSGNAYGDAGSFTTDLVVPTVTTVEGQTYGDYTSATLRGKVELGDEEINEQGFLLADNEDMTGAETIAGELDGDGNLTADKTGLTSGGTYYIKAYVTTDTDTYYGDIVSFKADETSNISDIASDAAEKVEVARYYIVGRQIAAPQKGINIVRYSDGTVDKVIEK